MARMHLKRLAVAAALAGVFGGAQAADVAPLLTTNPILFSDNSADFLINVDGSTAIDPNTGLLSATVTTGDILFTITGINTVESGSTSTTIGAGTTFNELTTLSAVKISTFSDVDLGPPGPDDSFGTQAIDLGQYTAVALSATDALYFNWATGAIDVNGDGTADFTFTPCLGSTNNSLTFGCMFEDPSNDYTRDGTVQAGLTSATDGTARLLFTLNPANGDFLSVVAPIYTDSFGAIPAATAIDNTNISLDATIAAQNWAPLVFGSNITGGNGGFSSPTSTSGFPIFDNLDLTTSIRTVPEPSSLLLLSLGLVALGFSAKRGNKAA